MARKARGTNATSAKVDPAKGRGRQNKKMGLAEEVRGMLPKNKSRNGDDKPLPVSTSVGRKVSAAGMITLSTSKEENEDEEDEGDADFAADPEEVLSEADDAELVEEDEEEIETLSDDELDEDEETAEFSDSSEGSEAAEIDVDDLVGIEDVDALEQVDLSAIDMPEGEALAKLQEELRADDSDEEDDEEDEEEDEDVSDSEKIFDDEEDEEEVALSDIGSDKDAADIVPIVRETINNTTALNAAYNRIVLELPEKFSLHHTLTTDEPLAVVDVNDDLSRELEFYKQGLIHAQQARDLIQKEGAAWERPSDYFAEMVKTDDHMERIRKELVQEATAKKASADARRQRDLKKFGKQVQINKTLERAKEKKATTDKIKALKRKRGANELEGKEDFDVALDEAVAGGPPTKRSRDSDRGGRGGRGGRGAGRGGRDARDAKFGFGGKKRFAKSNTAESTYDMAGFNNSKPSRGGSSRGGGRGGRGGGSSRGGRGGSRGGSARPGKSKRH